MDRPYYCVQGPCNAVWRSGGASVASHSEARILRLEGGIAVLWAIDDDFFPNQDLTK